MARPSTTLRIALGVVIGAGSWPVLSLALPWLPVPLRFLIVWALFTAGPGTAATSALTGALEPWQRIVIALGAGSALTPALIDAVGRLHRIDFYPFLTAALAGLGAALWRGREEGERPTSNRGDLAACAAIVLLAASLGYVAFAHRYTSDARGLTLYGDYDSADLAYYAAEATEASHTVPPMAAYYSGHALNAAVYPQLVLGMVHRFADVPIFTMYFAYAWPTFLATGALVAFLLVRTLASRGAALLAVVLVMAGSDFSYLAAWFLPHADGNWDYLLWPTNFLSPTMAVQYFATWTPSMPVFWASLFAIVQSLRTRRTGWLILSGVLIGVLFQFKPFIYVPVLGGLAGAAVFTRDDWSTRVRLAATAVLAVVCTSPFLLAAASLAPEDRRSQLLFDPFFLPRQMLVKLDLVDVFSRAADRIAVVPALRPAAYIVLAALVFFPVGIGLRMFGLPGVWRAIRGRMTRDHAMWRVLAWAVVAGIGVPCLVRTEPYVDTLQFYLTGLYVLWIFTAVALVKWAASRGALGVAGATAAVITVLPSSAHYLSWKWTEATRAPRSSLSSGDLRAAAHLRTLDPESTVVLVRHEWPSLITIAGERRIVLGWDVKYSAVGGEERLRDVNQFFRSADGDASAAIATLDRYHVTHVIVHEQSDHVHPDVLARLTLVLRASDVALYAVHP